MKMRKMMYNAIHIAKENSEKAQMRLLDGTEH
jgi:hypothetical protein